MSFQEEVAGFVSRHGLEAPVEVRLLDLTSEVGELAKESLKASAYGRQPFTPGENWAAELGDVLFSLTALANSTGVDLREALSSALAKYESRLSTRQDPGSSS